MYAFQPSPIHTYSIHTYISGNKDKQKKQIIFLYISVFVVLPCIQQKYTCPSWISTPEPGASSRRHWSLCKLKTEFMCFKQEGGIFTSSGKPLKLVDQFIYFGSHISSTERNVNIDIGKVWTAINRLLIIWKSDQIKWDFFQVADVSSIIWIHLLNSNKTHGEKAWWELHKNVTCYFEQIQETIPHKTSAVRPLTSNFAHHDKQDELGTAGKVRTISKVKIYNRLLHMEVLMLAEQQGLRYISSVQTLDTV